MVRGDDATDGDDVDDDCYCVDSDSVDGDGVDSNGSTYGSTDSTDGKTHPL
jgi:hypothetical protein